MCVVLLGGNWDARVMGLEIPAGGRELLAGQEGVMGRSQGMRFGLSAYSMRHRVLDGKAAHPEDEQWADKRRDRRHLAVEKIVTMRFGHVDLRAEQAQCRTAADVVGVLRARGRWVGMPCQLPGCPVGAEKAPSLAPDRGWFAAWPKGFFRFHRQDLASADLAPGLMRSPWREVSAPPSFFAESA
jgi:hypothetical protein